MSPSRPRARSSRAPRHRRILFLADEEPLAAVANLFDVAMVFAVALLLAMFTALSVPGLMSSTADVTIVRKPGKPDMEIVVKKGLKVERYPMTQDALHGHGQRLGVAYRLPNGEVVYVPEGAKK